MITRLQKTQLVVLLIVAIVAIIFVGAKYARIGKMSGLQSYTVTAEMVQSGGIFENAEVTYMGVPVGRVGELSLKQGHVDVPLVLDKGGPEIPASAEVVVASRSAIGEQYIDLRPVAGQHDSSHLRDGSVILSDRVTLPTPVADVVDSSLNLASTLPLNDVHTTVTELGKGFRGQTDNLTRLLDSLSGLSKTYSDHRDEMASLLRHSDPVLATQAAQADNITSWSRNLDTVAQVLKSSDPSIRRLLTTGQTSATQISELVDKNGGDFAKVVGDLGQLQRTVKPALTSTNASLALLGALAGGTAQALPGDGTVHYTAVFDFETGGPPPCTVGYESTYAMIREMKRKNPSFRKEVDEFPFNTKVSCTAPMGSQTGVRGSARVGLADPSKPVPWDHTPKKDPDALNLNPLATELAYLLGVKPANPGGFGDAGRALGIDGG